MHFCIFYSFCDVKFRFVMYFKLPCYLISCVNSTCLLLHTGTFLLQVVSLGSKSNFSWSHTNLYFDLGTSLRIYAWYWSKRGGRQKFAYVALVLQTPGHTNRKLPILFKTHTLPPIKLLHSHMHSHYISDYCIEALSPLLLLISSPLCLVFSISYISSVQRQSMFYCNSMF